MCLYYRRYLQHQASIALIGKRLLELDVKKQVELLGRGVLGITPTNGLEEKLTESLKTGKPLNVKLGLDPTAPDIHLGFAVVLRKLRQFQDLGHQVIIIIGDYTALIGDPSGRSATRPMLSRDEIVANASTYVDQLSKILDREKTTVRFNSEWLGKLDFAQMIHLTSKMTVAQVMEREDFSRRYRENQPISLHELLYPLAQAYDSVCIEADIEMGGQDQLFNIMAGRDLQKELGHPQQVAFYMPLLVGLDGVKKMSKSLGNYVGIAESPGEMFGKLMSMNDEMMKMYFTLCTDVPENEIADLLTSIETDKVNPKLIKKRLAREIISIYHGSEAAQAADDEFESVHARHELPPDIREIEIPRDSLVEGKIWICRLLVLAGMATGTGKARTLVEQGGVKISGAKVTDSALEVSIESVIDGVIQVGPRNFVRIK